MLSGCHGIGSRFAIAAAAVLAYFVAFPEDGGAVMASVSGVLDVTNSVSPWAYGLLAVMLACSTASKVWGPRPG